MIFRDIKQHNKVYILDKINVTIAGFPKNLGEKVTFDNFNPDFSSNGKLAFKHVKGGIVLVDTTFTIKR